MTLVLPACAVASLAFWKCSVVACVLPWRAWISGGVRLSPKMSLFCSKNSSADKRSTSLIRFWGCISLKKLWCCKSCWPDTSVSDPALMAFGLSHTFPSSALASNDSTRFSNVTCKLRSFNHVKIIPFSARDGKAGAGWCQMLAVCPRGIQWWNCQVQTFGRSDSCDFPFNFVIRVAATGRARFWI